MLVELRITCKFWKKILNCKLKKKKIRAMKIKLTLNLFVGQKKMYFKIKKNKKNGIEWMNDLLEEKQQEQFQV